MTHHCEPGGPGPRDPTQEFIRECCEAIQERWTPAERARRQGTILKDLEWTVPECRLNGEQEQE